MIEDRDATDIMLFSRRDVVDRRLDIVLHLGLAHVYIVPFMIPRSRFRNHISPPLRSLEIFKLLHELHFLFRAIPLYCKRRSVSWYAYIRTIRPLLNHEISHHYNTTTREQYKYETISQEEEYYEN
jgi:hypothetical protein